MGNLFGHDVPEAPADPYPQHRETAPNAAVAANAALTLLDYWHSDVRANEMRVIAGIPFVVGRHVAGACAFSPFSRPIRADLTGPLAIQPSTGHVIFAYAHNIYVILNALPVRIVAYQHDQVYAVTGACFSPCGDELYITSSANEEYELAGVFRIELPAREWPSDTTFHQAALRVAAVDSPRGVFAGVCFASWFGEPRLVILDHDCVRVVRAEAADSGEDSFVRLAGLADGAELSRLVVSTIPAMDAVRLWVVADGAPLTGIVVAGACTCALERAPATAMHVLAHPGHVFALDAAGRPCVVDPLLTVRPAPITQALAVAALADGSVTGLSLDGSLLYACRTED